VRDLLLGREPEDYDVATSATPDVVLGMFPRTFAVGAHFERIGGGDFEQVRDFAEQASYFRILHSEEFRP